MTTMADDTTAGTGPITDGSNLLPPGNAEAAHSPAAPDAKALHNDIARILEEVKLPERRAFTTSGDATRKKEEIAATPAPSVPMPPKDVPKEAEKVSENTAKTGAVGAASGEPTSTAAVHTLKDDLQNVVRNKKMSIVHAVALEEEKRRGQERSGAAEQKSGTRNIANVVLGVLAFAIVAAGALYGAYIYKQGKAPASSQKQDTPLFFADRTVVFPLGGSLSGSEVKRVLAQGLGAPRASLGAIMRIMPTVVETEANGTQSERPSTIEEFLKATGAQAGPDLIRAFRGDFFLGIHTTAEKNSPVLVIPVSSYERAFAGLLAWEATMNDDLAPLFTLVPALTIDESGLLTSRKFEDGILENYDIRVLKDDSGAVKLLYSFPTRGILIIAESPDSFTEVLGRLRAARQL